MANDWFFWIVHSVLVLLTAWNIRLSYLKITLFQQYMRIVDERFQSIRDWVDYHEKFATDATIKVTKQMERLQTELLAHATDEEKHSK